MSTLGNKHLLHMLKDKIDEDADNFKSCDLEQLDNFLLRELHAAIINEAKELATYSPNNDPRIKTLKGNRSKKCLMSIDPEN